MAASRQLISIIENLLTDLEASLRQMSSGPDRFKSMRLDSLRTSVQTTQILLDQNRRTDETRGLDLALALAVRPRAMDTTRLPPHIRALDPSPRRGVSPTQEEVRKAHLDSVKIEYDRLQARLDVLSARLRG